MNAAPSTSESVVVQVAVDVDVDGPRWGRARAFGADEVNRPSAGVVHAARPIASDE